MNENLTVGSVIIGAAAFLFLAVVGMLSLIRLWQNFKDEEKTCLTEAEIDMYNQGYVFSSVWTLQHLDVIAKELNYVFTRADYVRIIKLIKEDFTPDEGITKEVIKMNMRVYVMSANDQKLFISPNLADI